MVNENQQEKLIIRNTKWKIEELFTLAAIIGITIIFNKNGDNSFLIIPACFFLIQLVITSRRILNSKPQLIINSKGISILKQGIEHHWNSIDYCSLRVFSKKMYLVIHIKGQDYSVCLDNYAYSNKELKSIINIYSTFEEKEDYAKLKRANIKGISRNVDKELLNKLFSKYRIRQSVLGFILFFILFSLSIYAQTLTSFPYVFASGFVVTAIGLFIFVKQSEQTFRNKPEIRKLTDLEFERFAVFYEVKYEKNKKRERFGKILMVIFIIGIYFVSYLISNS